MQLAVFPYYWNLIESRRGDSCELQAWCLDRDSKRVLLRFQQQTCSFYCEFPGDNTSGKYDKGATDAQWEKFYKDLKDELGELGPVQGKLYRQRRKLGDNSYSDQYWCRFPSAYARRVAAGLLATWNCKVFEADVPLLRQFKSKHDIKFSSWIRVDVEEVQFPTVRAKEYWATKPVAVPDEECANWVIYPKILAFDIETHCDRPDQFSDARYVEDEVLMISATTKTLGLNDEQTVVFTRVPYGLDNGYKVVYCETEREMFIAFEDFVRDYGAELIVDYNGTSFDVPYLHTRSRGPSVLREFGPLGLSNREPTVRRVDWKNNQTEQRGKNWDIDGTPVFDMCVYFRREYAFLGEFTLDHVSKIYLGETKLHDAVKWHEGGIASEIELHITMLAPAWHGFITSERILQEKTYSNEVIDECWRGQHNKGQGSPYSTLIGLAVDDREVYLRRWRADCLDLLHTFQDYAAQDAALLPRLVEKQSIWYAIVALSQTSGLTIQDLYLRGLGARVSSLLYHRCYQRGITMTRTRELEDSGYEGGLVGDPDPGYYERAATIDFSGMYPSIIRAFNICYLTLRSKPSPTTIEASFYETIKGQHKKLTYYFDTSEKGVLTEITEELSTSRARINKIYKAMTDIEKKSAYGQRLFAEQNARKITGNSVYGVTASTQKSLARCITGVGRKHIMIVNDIVASMGGRVVYNDTDGCTFINVSCPDDVSMLAFVKAVLVKVNEAMPKPMVVELEKYGLLLIYGPKRYIYRYWSNGDWAKNDRGEYVFSSSGDALKRGEYGPAAREAYKGLIWLALKKNDIVTPPKLAERFGGTYSAVQQAHEWIVESMHSMLRSYGEIGGWKRLTFGLNIKKDKYKSLNASVAVFMSRLRSEGKPLTIGSRVRYLVVRDKTLRYNKQGKVGTRMRLADEYKDRVNDNERIDLIYVWKRMFAKPLDKCFSTAHRDYFLPKYAEGYKALSDAWTEEGYPICIHTPEDLERVVENLPKAGKKATKEANKRSREISGKFHKLKRQFLPKLPVTGVTTWEPAEMLMRYLIVRQEMLTSVPLGCMRQWWRMARNADKPELIEWLDEDLRERIDFSSISVSNKRSASKPRLEAWLNGNVVVYYLREDERALQSSMPIEDCTSLSAVRAKVKAPDECEMWKIDAPDIYSIVEDEDLQYLNQGDVVCVALAEQLSSYQYFADTIAKGVVKEWVF